MTLTLHTSTGVGTSPDQALSDDWFSALDILHRVLPESPITQLVMRTMIRLPKGDVGPRSHFVSIGQGLVTILVNPKVLEYPRIERVEIMLAAACDAWKLHSELKWADYVRYTHLLGCDYSYSLNPRERWRWIESLPNVASFAIWQLEDRPRCHLCTRPIPTGSDCHPTRRDVHENCGYELDVLMEAVRKIEGGKE